ncbi:cation:proton antiporter domain-containing protein [Rickettsiella massiliensis]|uniref:cation:proton antiporter domain-containing protein n=1 Tax=Rickettsiella massiliensis TaxID=676517 RepID=UPI00030A7017|nr:cation:proton antiporter [Rickettsiella massiliensis]
MLLIVHGAHLTGSKWIDLGLTFITFPFILGFAFVVQHYFISKLFVRFDRVKEYLFLVALGWCLGLAELSRALGLSAEIGAFLAGVSIAEGPIAAFIADNLKPLRDFCLTMFFFAIGASFESYRLYYWLASFCLSSPGCLPCYFVGLARRKALLAKWVFV